MKLTGKCPACGKPKHLHIIVCVECFKCSFTDKKKVIPSYIINFKSQRRKYVIMTAKKYLENNKNDE